MNRPAGLLLLLCLNLAHADVPMLRTVGLHLISADGAAATWLGPGGHPAWTPDGRRLYVEAHHGSADAPPLGPLYTVAAVGGEAQGLTDREPFGCLQLSPSGRYLAALTAAPGGMADVVMLTAAGSPVAAAQPLGPLTSAARQSFAWLPDERLLLAQASPSPFRAPGVWLLSPTGDAAPVAAGPGADGVWPAPSGRQALVRMAGQLVLLELGERLGPPAVVWPQREGVSLEQVIWEPDGQGFWVQTTSTASTSLRRLTLAGAETRTVPLPGPALSLVGGRPPGLLALIRVDGGPALVELSPTGVWRPLARIHPDVPIPPHQSWLAPAPALSPDGRRVAVALGRTDRYGMRDIDRIQTTDVTVTGASAKVTRRLRNVGSSGVVFRSPKLRFLGRERPKSQGPAVDDTRPGTMRWARPSPARWVVLHHTATTSDRGSLNALTSPSAGRIARLYEDITPGADLKGEPGTIGVTFLVLRNGTVIQLAEEETVTRHAGTGQWANAGPIYDFNVETIGIEIVARGNDFTGAQVRKVGRLVGDLCRRHGIPLRQIAGEKFAEGVLYHRDFAGGLRGKPDPAGWPWQTMMRHTGG